MSNERYSLYYQKIQLLYKRPEVRASLEIILSVFTVLILISAAIRPTLVNVTSLQKKIEDQETINKKADNKISQLLTAQKQLNDNVNNLVLFDDAVPDGFSYTDSGERLQYLAQKNNIKIDSLSFTGYTLYGKVDSKKDWGTKIATPDVNNLIPDSISFSIIGKPQNVINFLKEVENMDRVAVLDSVSLSKQLGLTAADDTLKASCRITFYFYNQQ